MEDKWITALRGNPLPWLLEDGSPAVRQTALRLLLDRPEDAPDVIRAHEAAMESNPIAAILAAQHPRGYWVKPGPGYGPKYMGTVWQVVFLDQLGADGRDGRIQKACDYVLTVCPTESGGFGCSASSEEKAPPPSAMIHCLHGNLLRALIGFGRLEDPRVQRAIDWQTRAITGNGFDRYYKSSTSAPGFCCAANNGKPCAWGAVKSMLGLARVPENRRSAAFHSAVEQGIEFLLSSDPSTAEYPTSRGEKPSQSWFKLGFPLGYVTDVLQNIEALCEHGMARDPRLQHAVQWLLEQQDEQGRWRNRYAYNGKTWVDFEKQGEPSKWVTLRACRVIKAVFA
jgi:hypothetical protein